MPQEPYERDREEQAVAEELNDRASSEAEVVLSAALEADALDQILQAAYEHERSRCTLNQALRKLGVYGDASH